MPKYKVREGEFIVHDNRAYSAGDTLTCSEEQAKMLRVDPLETTTALPALKSGDVSVAEAAAAIAAMTDAKDIRKYIKGDDRKGVNDAADARLEALKA
jgi:hypothetical protein